MHTIHRPPIDVPIAEHGTNPVEGPYDCCTSSVPPRVGLCTRPAGHDGRHEAGAWITQADDVAVIATWDDDRSTDA